MSSEQTNSKDFKTYSSVPGVLITEEDLNTTPANLV